MNEYWSSVKSAFPSASSFFAHGRKGTDSRASDKEDWALIAKLNEEGLYRCSYAELGHLTEEEARERLPMKFEKILPGPRPLKYELISMSPYRIHQRCASTFRWGRVLLAGDAAHCAYIRFILGNQPFALSNWES